MVGGQQEDMENEGRRPGREIIERIHDRKTAALIACAMAMGAEMAGCSRRRRSEVETAGRRLGRAFQAADDLLDVRGEAAEIGKTPGKDVTAGKLTWVAFEGLEKASLRAEKLGREGVSDLRRLLPDNRASARLLELVTRLWVRTH